MLLTLHYSILFMAEYEFSFFRNLHTVLPNLQSHQQCRKVPFSPYPVHCLLSLHIFLAHTHGLYNLGCCIFTLFSHGHSDWCKAVLQCSFKLHFLIITNKKHIFLYILAISMSPLEQCLFRSSPPFLIGLFGGYLFVCF